MAFDLNQLDKEEQKEFNQLSNLSQAELRHKLIVYQHLVDQTQKIMENTKSDTFYWLYLGQLQAYQFMVNQITDLIKPDQEESKLVAKPNKFEVLLNSVKKYVDDLNTFKPHGYREQVERLTNIIKEVED